MSVKINSRIVRITSTFYLPRKIYIILTVAYDFVHVHYKYTGQFFSNKFLCIKSLQIFYTNSFSRKKARFRNKRDVNNNHRCLTSTQHDSIYNSDQPGYLSCYKTNRDETYSIFFSKHQ